MEEEVKKPKKPTTKKPTNKTVTKKKTQSKKPKKETVKKEKKPEIIIIPDLRDKELEEAQKILDKNKIKYEEETEKKYSLTVGKGKVVKTEPDAGYIYDEKKPVVIYESRGKWLILFIILAVLAVGALSLTYGKQILDSLNEQIIEIQGKVKAPEIDLSEFEDENGNIVWTKANKIKLQKPDKRIKSYKYCIREEKSSKNCVWQETEEPIILIPGSGHLYITIIPIDENGKEGQKKEIEVYVDQNNPAVDKLEVIEVTTTTIKVRTLATDKESGIEKYLYSIDGVNYVEDNIQHLFKDLTPDTEYTIYVKVIDNVGNETLVSIKVKTLKEDTTADDSKEKNKDTGIYEVLEEEWPGLIHWIEEAPEFPGGNDSLNAFIKRNLQYPKSAKEQGIEGTVFVRFVVETDGSVTVFRINQDVNEELAAEAIRLVNMLPKWKPGYLGPTPVRVGYTLPIVFKLDKE